tara:strand:+ start:1815 stop:2831 length:1017 start_codon:yes stop_codon:yes gene_type:complete
MDHSVLSAPLTAKDFASDEEVRWCPGCGDYAILKSMQKALVKIGARPETTVFVSGIGCASRFPYYMNTYGFHTIHGRAPAIATGAKLANPDLDIWVITGDGDGLSIGGNHLLHVLRRNIDLQVLLFNNEIYGLTKGQSSPTSRLGTRSPSTPNGSIESPVSPLIFALGSGANFVARAVDVSQVSLQVTLERAHAYKGAAFVEIFQNCIVYNDGVFNDFTERNLSSDRQIHVQHGQPLIYGKNKDIGLKLDHKTLCLESVKLGRGESKESDLIIHDERNRMLAVMLASMRPPDLPMALGVILCDPVDSISKAAPSNRRDSWTDDLNKLMRAGHTWTVGT